MLGQGIEPEFLVHCVTLCLRRAGNGPPHRRLFEGSFLTSHLPYIHQGGGSGGRMVIISSSLQQRRDPRINHQPGTKSVYFSISYFEETTVMSPRYFQEWRADKWKDDKEEQVYELDKEKLCSGWGPVKGTRCSSAQTREGSSTQLTRHGVNSSGNPGGGEAEKGFSEGVLSVAV